jgi:hypothetical protein
MLPLQLQVKVCQPLPWDPVQPMRDEMDTKGWGLLLKGIKQ